MPFTLALLFLSLLIPLITTMPAQPSPTTNTSGLQIRAISPPDPCAIALTYHTAPLYNYSSAEFAIYESSTSTGELCCKLCHESYFDCLFAKWWPQKSVCQVTVNHGDGTPGNLQRQEEWDRRDASAQAELKEGHDHMNSTDVCPNGIVSWDSSRTGKRKGNGEVHLGDWSVGNIPGPCYDGGWAP